MKALRNTVDGLTVLDVPAPPPSARRVQITSAGICGSDLHAIASGPIPVTLGHEFGGRLPDGTLVAVRPMVACGDCVFCRRGDEQLCAEGPRTFHGASRDGGLAEYVEVDERCLVPLPAEVRPADVSLVEPLAVAVHAATKAAILPGQRALVIGGGTIGLLCGLALLEQGATVDITVRHDRQRRAADALGLGRDPDGRYPVVVDAAGTTASLGQAVGATERGGRVVLVALPWDPIGIPITAVFKEVTIVPAVYYGRADGHSEFARAGHILAAHPELAGAIVTHRFGLVDGPAAFAVAADRAAGAIKVQVLPDEVGL